MKKIVWVGLGLFLPLFAFGQGQPSGKTLAATMEVFVFPTEGQEASQQSQDEAACYGWASDNTGSDPFDLAKQEESDEQLAAAEMQAAEAVGQGAGAKGALRGAAAGALIGEVTGGDAGDSAAIGAAAVAVRSRRQGRRARQEAEQQVEQQAEQRQEATAEDLDNFKKAFSVCLEAKDYMVKF